MLNTALMRTERLLRTGRLRSSAGQPSAAAATANAEPVLGRYRLTRMLGSGAFATVWAAHDERLERDVAVKLIHRDRVVFARFEREARAAARLMHPAIVTLYEAAIDEHGAYLVSEMVRGKSLDKLLAAGRCSDRDILEVGISLCKALAYAHAEGVVHRDVKPSNVLVASVAAHDAAVAKLTDFGVARLLDDAHDSLTRTGEVLGTVAYMAPEQAQGREATAAADLYSLALVMYEALAGVNPLKGARGRTGARRRVAVYLPPLRRQRRDLPEMLARGLDRALSPRPADRGSVKELQEALEASVELAAVTPGVVAPRGWLAARRSASAEEDDPPGPLRREKASGNERAGSPEDLVPRAAGTPAGGTREQRLLRTANAALAGFAVWWLTKHLLSDPPIAPAAAAAAAVVGSMLAPRLAFFVLAAGITGLSATQGRAGAAALLALVAWLTIVAMPARGALWSFPAGAVLLGVSSLAGAWPAIAARSGARWWLRAAAAGVGFIWLAAAGALVGGPLYERIWPQPPPAVWTRSPQVTIHDLVPSMLHSGILAGAAVWALAAIAGPLLVTRQRPRAVALSVALLWAGATIVATVLAVRLIAPGAAFGLPRGAILGALAGAAILAAPICFGGARAPNLAGDVP